MKTNDQSKTDQAAPAPEATNGTSLAVAMVQPAPAAKATAAKPKSTKADGYHGRGGLYTRVNGVRTRVAVTKPVDALSNKEAKQ